MGGLMFIFGVIIAVVLTFFIASALTGSDKLMNQLKDGTNVVRMVSGILLAVGMALIGFIDDYIKVVKKRNLGLRAREKTFLQLLVAAGYLATLSLTGMAYTKIPFFDPININSGLGLLFWPIALFFIYGFTNAVNLTDGVDGLASSVTLVVALFFMLASGMLGFYSINVAASALAGGCVGFLVWNLHPARVFMGDTGSMFLGGMVVALAFGIERPVLLLFAGVLYFGEALSVMLQVAYYKRTKKRIFKMSPIHHHFEMSGWNENKIVIVFSLVAFIGCAVALLPILMEW
ncbi:MAG: phospho-N-acetylmuramoyl-pentapeptide-transferase [Clostridiales bacterium 43-6]|nr:MAG: phospho-N-acetylmuramoyl-pentapeptide-transferase [Clostridiales bacterium 43-6]